MKDSSLMSSDTPGRTDIKGLEVRFERVCLAIKVMNIWSSSSSSVVK